MSSDKASAKQRLRQLRRKNRGVICLHSNLPIIKKLEALDRRTFAELCEANQTNRANVGGREFTLTH